MTCIPVRLPGGGTAIVCTRGSRRTPRCSMAKCERPGRYQCDAKNALGHGTCDRWLCEMHRTSAGGNVDYCPDHGPAGQALDGV